MGTAIAKLRWWSREEQTLPYQRREDRDLVRQAKAGDHGAFSELHRRFARVVYAVLLVRVAYQDADDLVQEVFLAAHQKLSSLQDDGAFGGWLLQIARNRAKDHARVARPVLVEFAQESGAYDQQPPRLEASEVLAALRQLPETYSEPLVMRLVEGMTGPEIAARMGLSEGAVRVNLHRGMQRLKELLAAGEGA